MKFLFTIKGAQLLLHYFISKLLIMILPERFCRKVSTLLFALFEQFMHWVIVGSVSEHFTFF